MLWRRKWQPTPVFIPGESREQESLVAYSPWGCKRVRHILVTKQQHSFEHSTGAQSQKNSTDYVSDYSCIPWFESYWLHCVFCFLCDKRRSFEPTKYIAQIYQKQSMNNFSNIHVSISQLFLCLLGASFMPGLLLMERWLPGHDPYCQEHHSTVSSLNEYLQC